MKTIISYALLIAFGLVGLWLIATRRHMPWWVTYPTGLAFGWGMTGLLGVLKKKP